jgi:hypothetical protein
MQLIRTVYDMYIDNELRINSLDIILAFKYTCKTLQIKGREKIAMLN